jgi:hypothetical protein
MYNRVMKRASGLVVVVALAGSTTLARAESRDPFDVRTVPAAQTPSEQVSVPAPTETVVEHGASQRRVALWSAAGGVTLIASSFVLSYVEAGRFDSAVARNDIDSANHAADVARYVGTPLFFGGVAALAVAGVLYVSAPRLRERHIVVSPVGGRDQVGIAFTRGF